MELETSLNRYGKTDRAADYPSEADAQTNSISQSTQTPLTSKAAHGLQKAHIMDLDEGGEHGETEEDRLANEQAHRLKALADKMEGFVEGEGVMEGAIFDE